MDVKIKKSKDTKLAIIYHPNPDAVREQLEAVVDKLKEIK